MNDTHHTLRTGLRLVLLLSMLLYGLSTLPGTAPTFDEVAHLPAGWAQLASPGLILNPEHPPLAKLMAALPLWLSFPSLDALVPNLAAYDQWRFGRTLLFERGLEPQIVLWLGRLPMLMLLVGLMGTLWAFARRIYDTGAADAALFLGLTCPLLLAHGRLVTTDVPLATFAFLSAFLLWRYLETLQTHMALLLGLSVGATLSVKFSGIVFVPALGLVALLSVARSSELQQALRVGGVRTLVQLGGAAVLAWSVLVLSYQRLDAVEMWWQGLQQVGFNHVRGYPFYLLGSYSADGFLAYFPLALLFKLSWPVLITLAYAGVRGLMRVMVRAPVPAPAHRVLLLPGLFWGLPAFLYAFFIVREAPQIGVRYLIPVLPFLYLGLAPTLLLLVQRGGRQALLLLSVGASLTLWQSWPDPIASFNGLGGCGGVEAYRCLDDSNLDWGQNLGRIQAALEELEPERGVFPVAPRLLYFGTAMPGAYLERYAPMRPEELLHPLPAIYVVSSHRLNRLIEEVGRPVGVDWRQLYQPKGYVGNTYEIYDLRDVTAPLTTP